MYPTLSKAKRTHSGFHFINDINDPENNRNCVAFVAIDYINNVPQIKSSLHITEDLTVIVSLDCICVPSSMYCNILTGKHIQTFSQICIVKLALLKSWKNPDNTTEPQTDKLYLSMASQSNKSFLSSNTACDPVLKSRAQFLSEQMNFLLCLIQKVFNYSMVIFAYLLHSCSATCYKFIGRSNMFILPSIRRLQYISKSLSPQSESATMAYLRTRIKYKRYVVLMLDEIHVAKKLELSGGQIYGHSTESSNLLASTALCFMISSIAGKFRDVVAIYPVSNLTGNSIQSCEWSTKSDSKLLQYPLIMLPQIEIF